MVDPDRHGIRLYHAGLLLISLPMVAVTLLTALALDLGTILSLIAAAAPVLMLQLGALLAVSGLIGGQGLIRMSYGTLKLLQKPLRVPIHAPERMVVLLNNRRVLDGSLRQFAPERTLVLLPHCLQDHTCPHRLTFDPDSCQRCGKCPIGELLTIRDLRGVHFAISTGGTSARKTVKEIRPELIVAVACPFDLSLGILDVHPIETVGILNEWRNGECFDTWVDVSEVDSVLESLLERPIVNVKLNVPLEVSVLNGAFATDGGSISLLLSDRNGREHNVLLTQHLLPSYGTPGEREPGRLYFNGTLVGIRSEDELAILSALKNAHIEAPASRKSHADPLDRQPGMMVGDDIQAYYSRIAEGPEAALKHLVSELAGYVESEEYVTFARGRTK